MNLHYFCLDGFMAHLSCHQDCCQHQNQDHLECQLQYLLMKWLILLALLLCTTVLTADDGDWVDPFLLPIQFLIRPFYAGYLDIHSGKALYYVYTPSQNNPSKDPLMIMISPGPGCSSLHSWLYSKGQFVFVRNQQNFRHNPHNWNKEANVLYIEGPAGTGFSYGVEEKAGDETTQIEYYKAILRFYEKFPELKDQDFYLTGFGYAGIIAPKLALNIVEHNKDPQIPAWLKLNIKGLLMFNPCTMPEQCDRHFLFNHFTVKTLRNRFFISKELYEEYESKCTLRTELCEEVEKRIESKFELADADLTNLYKECLHQDGDYPCIDHKGIDVFLNVYAVKEDLNAKKELKWDLCNRTLTMHYQRDPDGSLKTYQKLLKEEHYLKIWIVSGTQSAYIPTWGTKKWVEQVKMDLKLPFTREWEPWFYKDINAGEVQEIPGLTLVTLRAAGFYMFEDQPEIAWHLYESFLKGNKL